MNEIGLFYRAFPKYTLAKKSDDGAGRKEDKSRVTILFSVNGDGSDRNIYMIGKSKSPRGTSPELFQQHGIQYFSNKSAWMTSEIFTVIVKDLDKKLNSPAVLILDNFSGHNIDEFDNLNFESSNIELQSWP